MAQILPAGNYSDYSRLMLACFATSWPGNCNARMFVYPSLMTCIFAKHRNYKQDAVDSSKETQTRFCTYCRTWAHPDYPSRTSLTRQLNAGLERHKNSRRVSQGEL